MRKTIKRVLIASMLMILSLAAAVFTACKPDKNQEELTKEKGYTLCVTYDANGGNFGANSVRTYALVKENSLAPAPGYVDAKTQASVKLPTRRNYRLVGGIPKTNEAAIDADCWYVAQTAEDGSVLRDENGNALLASDTPWDFAKDKVTADVTLVAAWEEIYRYILCVTEIDENGKTVEKELRSFVVKPGATIAEKLYNKEDGEFIDRADYIRINEKDYTLLDFYTDESLTADLDFAYVHPGQREVEETVIDPETNEPVTQLVKTNDVKIYAKYLPGGFELISKKSVEEDVPNLSSDSKWYLLEDVDLTRYNATLDRMERTEWDQLETFEGEIYGNGYSISGFEVRSQPKKPVSGMEYTPHSIFGRIDGVLDNLTLKEGVFTIDVANAFMENVIGEQRVAFLAYALEEEGVVNKVTVEDCQIVLVNRDKYEARINEEAGAIFYEWQQEVALDVKIIKDGEEVACLTPITA